MPEKNGKGRGDAGRRDRSSTPTFRLLAASATLILLTAGLALTVVEIIWPGGFWKTTLLDEGIMLFVTVPALYVLTFRPLLRLLDERKQSEEAFGRRSREMAALNAISKAAFGEPDTERLLARVLDIVLSIFDAQGGWLLMLGEASGSPPRIIVSRGIPARLGTPGSAELCLDCPTHCWGLIDRLPQGEVAVNLECRDLPREVLMAAGFGGFVGVLLPAGRNARAVMNLVWRAQRTLDDADRLLLRSIARHVGLIAESAARREAEQRARETADTIHSATLALNHTLDLDVVLRTLFDHVQRIVPYDRAKVMLLESASRLKVRAVFSPSGSPDPAGTAPSSFDVLENPLVGQVLETRGSVCVADMKAHPASSRREQADVPGSWLGVPLLAEGEAIGLFTLVKGAIDFYSPEQVKLVEALAAPAAVAIINARLFGEVLTGRKRLETVSRKLVQVQETERRHLARELHDEIGQSLTAILYRLEAIKGSSVVRNGILNDAIDITDRAMQSVRNLSLDLRPSLLDEAGLLETLRWYIDRQVRSDGLDVGLSVSPDLMDLSVDVRTACFRIVQEALTNVVRHAEARRAQVRIGSSGTRVELTVWDDGRGFDLDEAVQRARTGNSLGILGMQERAELLGGELVFESKPGAGTTVNASIPLSAPQ